MQGVAYIYGSFLDYNNNNYYYYNYNNTNNTSLGSAREADAAAEHAASRKEENMPALEANTSLRPSRSKPWAR